MGTPHLPVGLDGVIATETELSHVDGEAGRLVIAGYDAEHLAASHDVAATASLLWAKAPTWAGTPAELNRRLGAGRAAAWRFVPALIACSRDLSVIEGLRLGLAMLADEDRLPAADRLSGAAAVFVAALCRAKRGEAPVAPDASAEHTADFLAMLGGEPAPAPAVRALRRYLVTVSDHGMNASTFTARIIASTLAGPVSACVGAVGALKGPLHGGAPGPVLDMLDRIGSAERAAAWISDTLARRERLMGFGHKIYRRRDPRADILKAALADLRADNERLAFAEFVEATALSLLKARYPQRPLETNVEFYTALLLEAVGLPREAFTPVFAVGRIVGWLAHIDEQRRAGRLIRPQSRYVGAWPDEAAA